MRWWNNVIRDHHTFESGLSGRGQAETHSPPSPTSHLMSSFFAAEGKIPTTVVVTMTLSTYGVGFRSEDLFYPCLISAFVRATST